MTGKVGLACGSDPLENVSRETLARLEDFANLLRQWTARINLVAPASVPNLWERHVRDSAQVFRVAPNLSGLWLDIGTGGGFPGLVCAILAAEAAPTLRFRLVESDLRKATFLRTVARQLDLSFDVVADRIERCPPQAANTVTARALAPLSRLLDLTRPHLAPGGCAIFPKGRSAPAEIVEAERDWCFRLDRIPSITDPEASLLKIGDLRRA